MGIFDVSKAEKQFKELVGKTEAEELLKRVAKAESQNLDAQRILKNVDDKLKNKYPQISRQAGKLLLGKDGIIHFLSTKPYTTSNSNFVKLVANKLIKENDVSLQMFLENPDSSAMTSKIENIRASLMRYLKLTKKEDDDEIPVEETDENLKKKLIRNKKANIGEKMNSLRKSNRLKVIVTALIINLVDRSEKEEKEEGAKRKAEEEKRKKEEEAKRKAEEEKDKNQTEDEDPGIFRGLPNGRRYCYLNTALQNLYHNKFFSDKVLSSAIPEIEEGKQDKYKELRATQFFFKYLRGKISDSEFEKKRQSKAVDLGYKIRAHIEDEQSNSYGRQLEIERWCRNQMRMLAGKVTRDTPYGGGGETENKDKSISSDKEIEEALIQLYNDEALRNRVLAIDESQLSADDKNGSSEFGLIRLFFNTANGQNERITVLEQLKDLRQKIDRNDFDYEYAKRRIENRLNQLERKKRAYLLTLDSQVSIDNPQKNIKNSLTSKFRSDSSGEVVYLPLKKNRFVIRLDDRGQGSYGSRNDFEVEEDLDLSQFVRDKRLRIFQKLSKTEDKELEAGKCKFKLVSATIATGGHYYLYVKKDDEWVLLNDAIVTPKSKIKEESPNDADLMEALYDKDMKDAINGQSELLTYELKS